jgi:hypothetical protein
MIVNLSQVVDAFGGTGGYGVQDLNEGNALQRLTGLSDPNMAAIWLIVTSLTGIAVVALAALTHSVVPIGLHLFGTVFWTSYIRANSVLGIGSGYIPGEVFGVFFVGVTFIFIAAIIGMLTGSG